MNDQHRPGSTGSGTHDLRAPIPSQRHRFSLPREVVYLNCAYMSPLMDSVVAAGEQGIERKRRPWLLQPDDFFGESNQARELFARLVGSRARNIAIVPAASYGIAVAARNLPVTAGSTILTLADQFPSNVYAWRTL
ncbi:MAG: hypothetical protein KDK91_29115, partial [Gammaproteobacteria bacterium]|nr:hypothetical protein [Gammaproteobacteria bacterium]